MPRLIMVLPTSTAPYEVGVFFLGSVIGRFLVNVGPRMILGNCFNTN
jgi:hypothetical protein